MLRQRLRFANERHPHQPGQPLIHRVNRNRSSPQPVEISVTRQGRTIGKPAEGETIGLRFVGENLAGLTDKLLRDLSGLCGSRIERLRIEGSHAHRLRICVGHPPVEAFTTEDHHEAVFLDGLHKRFHTRDRDLLQFLDNLETFLGGNPASTTVGDQAISAQ